MEEKFDNIEENENANEPITEEEIVEKIAEEEPVASELPTDETQEEVAPEDLEKRKKAKKKKKVAILITAIALAVVILAAAVFAFIYFNNPKVLAKNSIKGAIADYGKREEFALLKDMVDGGSLAMSYEAGKNSVDGKLYFSDEALMLEGLKIKNDKNELEMNMYSAHDYEYIESEKLFGDDPYGIIRGEMSDAFTASIFAYKSTSKYKIIDDVKLHNAIQEILWAYDKEYTVDFIEDLEEICADYTKVIEKAVEKYADYEIEYKKVTTGGEKLNTRVVKIEIGEDEAVEIQEYILDVLEEDEELRAFIEHYAKTFEQTLVGLKVIEESSDEAVELFEKALDEWKDSLKHYEGEDIELKLYMPMFLSSKLYKAVYTEGDTVEVLDFGKKGIKGSQELSYVDNNKTYTYIIRRNNSSVYDAKLTFNDGGSGDTKDLFDIKIDWEDETVDLNLEISDTKLFLNGTLVKEKGNYTLAFTELEKNGTVDKEFKKLEFVMSKRDKMPEPRAKEDVKNCLAVTEEQFTKIIENLSPFFDAKTQ